MRIPGPPPSAGHTVDLIMITEHSKGRTMIRQAMLAIPCLVLAMEASAFASTVTSTLIDAGKTLEIADQGVRTFTERMNTLLQVKRTEFDRAAAERIRIRLEPYSPRPGEPPAKEEFVARHPIDRYLRAPSLDHWTAAKREVQILLMSVMYLLKDVKTARKDFVPDRPIEELSRFFDGDDSVQSQLALMVPPSSEQEMRAAKAVREKYWTLRRDLVKARAVFTDYIQSLPQTSKPASSP